MMTEREKAFYLIGLMTGNIVSASPDEIAVMAGQIHVSKELMAYLGPEVADMCDEGIRASRAAKEKLSE